MAAEWRYELAKLRIGVIGASTDCQLVNPCMALPIPEAVRGDSNMRMLCTKLRCCYQLALQYGARGAVFAAVPPPHRFRQCLANLEPAWIQARSISALLLLLYGAVRAELSSV